MTAADVVIVTFDTRDMTLRAIEHLDDPAVARVIVVDNGSGDGTDAAVRDRFPAATVVRIDAGVGFAAACNAGAKRGDAPLVLFLNSDVFARPGAIGTLIAELERHPHAVAAGGRLVDPGTDRTQRQYAAKRFPTTASLAVRVSGLERLWPHNPWTGPAARSQGGDARTAEVDQPAGACLLVRRPAFEAIAGFDERFWFWFEDVDIARRLGRLGPVLSVPTAVFEHLGGESFGAWASDRAMRSMIHGIVRYAESHLRRPSRLVLGLVLVASHAPRALVTARVPARRALHTRALRAGVALIRGRPAPDVA